MACLYASLQALRYPRACLSLEIPDFESSPSFISRALPDVSSDAPEKEEVSQGNLIFDGPLVVFCDHGSEFVRYITGQLQLVIAPFLL